MKRQINIQRTFGALQKMPLAVSFQKVEAWVLSRPKNQPSAEPNGWLQKLLNRFSNN